MNTTDIITIAQEAYDQANEAGDNWTDAVSGALQDAGYTLGNARDNTIMFHANLIAVILDDGEEYGIYCWDDGSWEVMELEHV